MDRLGEGEIFTIFERISNKEDKKSFALVCTLFLRVACFHLCWLYTKSPNLLFDILIASPKMLTFECHKPFSNNHIKRIAESCPNIKNLYLSIWNYLDHDEMVMLDFDDDGLCAIANACSHLVDVRLSRRLRFTEIGIASLVRSCKNLRNLFLDSCVNITDRSLKMIGEATRLEKLDLYGCHLVTDLGLEYLANGKLKHCLEKLRLSSCDRITDNGIIHLKKLASLRTLWLSRCGANITDYGVVGVCDLPDLEILFLDFLTNITDISLREIGRKCLKMLVLSLEGCEKITSVGLHAFSNHRMLSSLWLVSCYKLSWEDVKSTVLTCRNMSHLYLSRSIRKPDPGLKQRYLESEEATFGKCRITWR